MYILRLFLVTEQTLSRLVEALCDMFEGVGSTVLGTTQLILHRDEVAKRDSGSDIDQPSKKARALRLTNTDPAKTPAKCEHSVRCNVNDNEQSGGAISSITRGVVPRTA